MIRFKDSTYQNWPLNYGREVQEEDPSLAPYWARVDLSAFATNESEVFHATYHKDRNRRAEVFDRVNQDVQGSTGRSDFDATWVSVVTYKNIRPHDRKERGFEGVRTVFFLVASISQCCRVFFVDGSLGEYKFLKTQLYTNDVISTPHND